jgi:Ca2+-binding EF-hand superfamily protein
LMKLDKNNDGILSIDEMGELPEDQRQYRQHRHHNHQRVPMSLDANKDGILTLQEFDAAIDRVLNLTKSDEKTGGQAAPQGNKF